MQWKLFDFLKPRKARKARNNSIRPVEFSLNLKMSLLVFIIVIASVWTVSAFLVRQQNSVLNNRLQDTMRVYLETFRKNVEILLIRKGDRQSLNEFLDSYRNIKNFKMAMFVDNDGRILIHTFPQYLRWKVENASLRKFRKAIEEKVYIGRFEQILEEIPESVQTAEFDKNILGAVRKEKDRRALLKVYEKNTGSGNYELIDNAKKRDIDRANAVLKDSGYLVWKGYDGFMPFYHPLILSNTNAIEMAGEGMESFRQGEIFRNERVPEEMHQNFRFIRDLKSVYPKVPSPNGTNAFNPETEKRILKMQMTAADAVFLYAMKIRMDAFENGGDAVLTDDEVFRLTEIMKKTGVPKDRTAAYLIARQKKTLFSRRNIVKPAVRNTLRYLAFMEQFLSVYITASGKPTEKLDEFVRLFRGNVIDDMARRYANVVPRKNDYIAEFGGIFTRAYYLKFFREIASFYKSVSEYRYRDLAFDKQAVERMFSNMLGIYRLGTVRIILDMQKIRSEQKEIANRATDVSIFIILRALVITFIVVSFLIAPIRSLSDATDELARGNLEKSIRVSARDEIGQLADKFNIMTANLKKAFGEIKDKARMESELKNARSIQEAILPKSLPEISGFSFSVYYRPQTESGGDYYDFIEVDRGHTGIVVADVTGHGVGAGMVMAMLRSALRTFALKRTDASRVLKDVNPVLFRDTLPTMFATVFYGVIDHDKKEMVYTVAGHTQGILYNPADRKIRLLQSGGMPVGMVDSALFDPSLDLFRAGFKPGDFLILYTDGITEARLPSGEEYGDERFFQSIAKNAGEDLEKMKTGIISDLEQFTIGAEKSDDAALLIIKVG